MNGNGPFHSVSRTYSMNKKIGKDNKVYEEKYFDNNVVQKNNGGNTVKTTLTLINK